MTIFLVVVVVLTIALIAVITLDIVSKSLQQVGFEKGRASVKVEPKVFGLAEATAAKNFLTDRSQAKTVLSVIVGVLGYTNNLASEIGQKIKSAENYVAGKNEQVASLQEELAEIEASIKEKEAEISQKVQETFNLEQLENFFSNQL